VIWSVHTHRDLSLYIREVSAIREGIEDFGVGRSGAGEVGTITGEGVREFGVSPGCSVGEESEGRLRGRTTRDLESARKYLSV
jgi:hypothetical protein